MKLNYIYQGDCLEVLKTFPDDSVDLVLTDPPYNVGFKYDEIEDKKNDYEKWCCLWFSELQRISTSIFISTGTKNLAMWCRIKEPHWIVAWHKPGSMGNSPFGVCNWEPVLFWGKARHNSGVDVIRAPIIRSKELQGHPCPKPLEWGKRLVNLASNEGDIVLDPFLGSGTTAVAAKQLKRNYIGIEISEKYCEIARQRLRQEMLF